MIKAVAFDFDHTLYDRDGTYENLVDPFIRYFRGYLRRDLDRSVVLKVLQDCDRSGIYKAGHWEGIYQDTVESGIFLEPPSYEVYYDQFMECRYPDCIRLYDDTIPTLEQLRAQGYAIGILTNGPSAYQRGKIQRCGLTEHVDSIVVGGELKEGGKPCASAFAAVCRTMGCAPEEAAYVGDHPVNDVDGARLAGLTPIWIRSVGLWLDGVPPAPYAIDRLGELPPLLARVNGEV